MVSRPTSRPGEELEELCPIPPVRSLVVPLIGGELHGHILRLSPPFPDVLEIVDSPSPGKLQLEPYGVRSVLVGTESKVFYAVRGMSRRDALWLLQELLWETLTDDEYLGT